MKKNIVRALAPVTLAILLAGCGKGGSEAGGNAGAEKTEAAEGAEGKEAPKDIVTLSAQQVADAGIEVTRPTVGGEAGAIELSATIEGDPQGVQVVSAAVGGRLVSLTRNLGQSVGRGDPLAIIESREAASLKAEVEAARARRPRSIEPAPRATPVRRARIARTGSRRRAHGRHGSRHRTAPSPAAIVGDR